MILRFNRNLMLAIISMASMLIVFAPEQTLQMKWPYLDAVVVWSLTSSVSLSPIDHFAPYFRVDATRSHRASHRGDSAVSV